ncbi:enoyl-CoA hydratase/isomerase family protein [Mycolicibacterium septicum]|uniref:enoyl-CoA hydratase/isomerase family protein n=1 Tax=Mycolicibacterium septicum TaxID=98668 RepID=UPI00235E2D45|nr:enoyl-CoA hydratase/isomerase family protein [Mycolicibacterium septicum]
MAGWNRVSVRPIEHVLDELGTANTLTFSTPCPGVGVMAVNRPDRGNSQTVEMFGEIAWFAQVLRQAPLRALVVTGAGGATFCTGFDLAEVGVIAQMSVPEFNDLVTTAETGTSGLRALPYPVIGAVSGPAAGGGLSLALSADFRFGDASTSFSAGFVQVGLSIGELGASWHLSRVVGPAKAAEIAFTSRKVQTTEAYRLGLLNRITPDGEVLEGAIALAAEIAEQDGQEVRAAKNAMLRGTEIPSFVAALELENRAQVVRYTSSRTAFN